MLVVFFFFQAEDGIRDAQESRGLGDVYKRQGNTIKPQTNGSEATVTSMTADIPESKTKVVNVKPVSYTHLTLPTIYSV